MRLVYISPVNWKSYAQRPHFMVEYFLKCGGNKVLWVNPYPGRLPRWSDLHRDKDLHNQGTALVPKVVTADFRALPIEPLPGGYYVNRQFLGSAFFKKVTEFVQGASSCILGIGKPCRLAVDILDCFSFRWSYYDAMDDFPVFHEGLSRKTMADNELRIRRAVQQIFVSSHGLERKFVDGDVPVKLVRNACDMSILPSPRQEESQRRSVLGYIGSLGDWFDWEIVKALANVAPECEIRLIGPHLVPPPNRLPRNVTLLPACPHQDIGKHLKQFDVGLIPFRKTPLTNGVDPIKYYEYRAMGIPVIATSFGEMALRQGEPGLFFADDVEGLETTLRKAFSFFHSSEESFKWRAENSWSVRFQTSGVFTDLNLPGLNPP